MKKVLIHTDPKAESFKAFVEEIKNEAQSLINDYNRLGIGEATEAELHNLSFEEVNIRERMANKLYHDQKGVRMSTDSIARNIEIPEPCFELDTKTKELKENIRNTVYENFRIISDFAISKVLKLIGSKVEINEAGLNKIVAQRYQMFIENEKQQELYDGLKNFEQALQNYKTMLDKISMSSSLFLIPRHQQFPGFKFEAVNYPNTTYKVVIDPEFVTRNK